MRFKDRVAVITGGTGGLGKAVVSVFLGNGAKVFSTNTRTGQLGDSSELKEVYKDRLIFGKADVTKANDMAKAVEKTMLIRNIRLVEKRGGQSGEVKNE